MVLPIITRFAPSPTGYLHLGHAYSALLNAEAGDRFLLRLEDIDHIRCRAEFATAIYEDLAWLGLAWEAPVLVQSQRLPLYQAALMQLRERGLLYRCFKSRKDIEDSMAAPHAAPGQAFTGSALPEAEEAALLEQGQPYAWRLSMAAAAQALGEGFGALQFQEMTPQGMVAHPAQPERFGDVVLGRKDSGTSYHLASVFDDAAQGVNRIIRGEELREAAGLHALLYALLGHTAPVYQHHTMLTNDAGERLSKRDGALALRAMREAGWSPEQVRAEAFARPKRQLLRAW